MRLVHLFEQVNLYEAAKDRYMQPFVGILQYADEMGVDTLRGEVEDAISWAMQTLKKDDRIIWYLRWVKLEALRILRANTPDETKERIYAAWKKAANQMSNKTDIPTSQMDTYAHQVSSRDFRRRMDHFLSLGLPPIENYVFSWQKPEEIWANWSATETEWQNKTKKYVPIERDDVETVIKFPDGSEWINLNKPYCDAEAKAMGHCGNKASYHEEDTVLSYRTIEKTEKGEMWKPRLTFILDTNTGLLGEMKGRANQKPDSKYHGVIIELLKHPMIKGIKGGGYAPENNFKMEDLPDDVADELIEEKPGLASIAHDYKKRGMTRELLGRMVDVYNDTTDQELPEYNQHRKAFMADTGETSVDDFVKYYGGDTAKWVAGILSGEEYLDIYETASEPEELWNELPDKITSKVGQWLIENHADAVEEWKEENDENYDPSDDKATWQIIEENSIDDVISALKGALLDGESAGTETEMFNSFKEWIDELPNGAGWNLSLYPGTSGWDKQQYIEIPEELMVDIVSDMLEQVAWHGNLISFFEIEDLQSPHYGWQDFDLKVAIERAGERLSDEGII